MGSHLRKVLLPINIKLTIVVLVITGATLGAYVYLAMDLFKTDKMAYVYESVETQGEQFSSSVETYLIQVRQLHELLPQASRVSSMMQKILKNHPNVLGYFEFKNNKSQRSFILSEKINPEMAKDLYNQSAGREFSFFTKKENLFIHVQRSGQEESVLILDQQTFKALVPQSRLYEFYLGINGRFLGKDASFIEKGSDLSSYYNQTIKLKDKIVSVIPVLNKEFVTYTSVEEEKAIGAATQLQNKSVYFAGLVAGFVIVVVILFSGLITKPIRKLYEASLALADADFSFRIKLKERDELGVLGDSFNFMAEKIQVYIGEMKEKSRLENELKTAQLVQKSFFPYENIQSTNLVLASYYKPASECGGDWWGHLTIGKNDIVIMLDVTGHGTAAALLTAIAHNSLTAIKHLSRDDKRYSQDSSLIMRYLNSSLCAVDINLNATAFVLVINERNINYTNASHNPPYFIKHNTENDYSKKDFLPLLEKSGPRLGESKNSRYENVFLDYSDGDHLVLFTDGILEAKSSEDKMFGQRNFIQSITNALCLRNKECLETILTDFHEFLGESIADDDITLLKLSFKKRGVYFQEITTSSAIQAKIKELNLIEVPQKSLADIIVYDQSLRSLLSESNEWNHIKNFIPLENFLKNENIFTEVDVDMIKKSSKDFLDENLQELTQAIGVSVHEIIDENSFEDMERYLKMISLELVQNALLYGRKHNCLKTVEFEISSTAESYSIIVKDRYGKLERNTFLAKVHRSYKERTFDNQDTGAGLGLGMILAASEKLVIRRKDGEFTRIHSIINKRKRLKEYRNIKTSLFFVEE